MTHADVRELIAPFAVDALDEPDRTRVAAHLTECGFCANLAREASDVASYVAYAAPFQKPPDGALERLLNSLEPSVPLAPQREREVEASAHKRRAFALPAWLRSPTFAPLAAALVLVLGLSGWNFSLMNQVHRQAGEMTSLQTRLAQQTRLLMMATSKSVVTRPLQSTPMAPNAEVRVIMDSDSNSAMIMAAEMPPLPSGYVYQVWLGRQGARSPAGRLWVDDQGDGECNLQLQGSVHSYDSAWITLEPMEGGPRPNGPGFAKGVL